MKLKNLTFKGKATESSEVAKNVENWVNSNIDKIQVININEMLIDGGMPGLSDIFLITVWFFYLENDESDV